MKSWVLALAIPGSCDPHAFAEDWLWIPEPGELGCDPAQIENHARRFIAGSGWAVEMTDRTDPDGSGAWATTYDDDRVVRVWSDHRPDRLYVLLQHEAQHVYQSKTRPDAITDEWRWAREVQAYRRGLVAMVAALEPRQAVVAEVDASAEAIAAQGLGDARDLLYEVVPRYFDRGWWRPCVDTCADGDCNVYPDVKPFRAGGASAE